MIPKLAPEKVTTLPDLLLASLSRTQKTHAGVLIKPSRSQFCLEMVLLRFVSDWD